MSNAAANTAARKVTFGKMEVFDTSTGEAEATIEFPGGFGSITKEVEDIGGTSFEYVAAGYTLELFFDDGADVTETFTVQRSRRVMGRGARRVTGAYATARKALAAAKAHARSVVAERRP